MTKLGMLNRFLLQFLFIRLYKNLNDKNEFTNWGILGFVLPFTGWSVDYIYLWKFKKDF